MTFPIGYRRGRSKGMLPGILTIALGAMPTLAAGHAACRLDGSRFVPKGHIHPEGYNYRLVISIPSSSAGNVGFDSIWSFQAVSVLDGRVLAETRAGHYCPNGRGNCQIVAPHTPADQNYATDEIELNSDFSPTVDGTPRAIVIPGFVDKGWAFSPPIPNRLGLLSPNLDDLVIWVRVSCGES